MADSSNGKLEETLKVQPDDEVKVVESVTDIAIDDYSAAGKKTHDGDDSSSSSSSSDEETEAGEKSAKVADSGEVEETKEVSVVVVETVESLSNHLDQGVVDDLEAVKEEEEKVLASVDGTNESSPAITDLVSEQIEEKTLTYLDESNGVSLAETDLVSKEVEEPALPSLSEHDEPAPVITDVEEKSEVVDVVSKRIEETIGESSSENVVDGSSKPSPDQVPPPLESADAGEEYGKPVIPESTGNPSIVSVTGRPLQPTSWKSCCGLFEVLHRSNR
ncbi:PREDICTED: histone H3 v1 isoform [Prunus dulcis]|uniref:PREDICTED: histone H3 v1 isoform n=1 Tax=Prunus dulcis TaxID=3755 RepID=A0A5E4FMC1_PRUDU|nr:histone H3.v1 [Prunus dulcis]VVA28610.1 PREDICTED: histone H3 v1 isoform [Prunus dulcis]